MMQRIARKMRGEEEGFTLIELMVVVLIIGILIAIALPTFLGARKKAENRAAQSDLRNGIAAAKVYFTDNDTYTGFDKADGAAVEPSLSWEDGAVAADTKVHILDVVSDGVLLVRYSKSGTYFGMADKAGVIAYCQDATATNIDTRAECTGTAWT